MEEAFAQAEATFGTTDGTTDSPGSSDPGQPQGESTPAAAAGEPGQQGGDGGKPAGETPRQPSDPGQAELDRINTLVAQGRIGELSARQRGLYNTIAQRALETQQLREAVVDRALELRAMETDDPAAYVDWRRANPTQAKSYDEFWELPEYKNITAENRRPQRSEEQIRSAVQAEWEGVVSETAQAIATDGGLSGDEYGRLVTEHGKNLGSLLQASFNAAVDKAVQTKLASERARVEAEVTEAVRHELDVQYATRNSVRFPSGGVTGNPAPAKPPAAGSMEEAFDQAEEQFARFANAR